MQSRRKAFSHKQKKQQLRERRERHAARSTEEPVDDITNVVRGRAQPPAEKKDLKSIFAKEPKEVIEARIATSRQPYRMLPPAVGLEIDHDDLFPTSSASLDLPRRPAWAPGISREELERNEEVYYRRWLNSLLASVPSSSLSFFEQNLQVWRQLWRVGEMSDILIVVVDARHPVIHFPPSLYRWIKEDLGRQMVLVINKADLVSDRVLAAWEEYFQRRFPGLHVARFSCYPRAKGEEKGQEGLRGVGKARKRGGRRAAVGVREVLEACRSVEVLKKGKKVDWDEIIEKYERSEQERRVQRMQTDDADSSDDEPEAPQVASEPQEAGEGHPHADWVTIGLVGHPNVGKSSIINGIMGKKVVSTSRTPGHTKHFQTIHLTPTVRLSDCPGLVFPSLIPRPQQVLSGVYNIAQVNEPYTVVQFLAERVDLPHVLGLVHPALLEQDDEGGYKMPTAKELAERQAPPWTAWAICEAVAIRKGFYTAKAARPDAYRAANYILRMAFDGRILMSMKPRGYYQQLQGEEEDERAQAEVDMEAEDEEDEEDGAAEEDEEEDEDDDEEEEEEEEDTNDAGKGRSNAKPTFHSKNPFALLGGDHDESEESEDSE